jgi:ankyrin repeat protein
VKKQSPESAARREALLNTLLNSTRGRLADVNTADEKGMTPFRHAVSDGDEEAVALCLERAAPDVNGDDGFVPPLFLAERCNSEPIVRRLLRAGAQVDRPSWGRTCLHMATGNNHIGIVQLLLDGGAAVDSCDDNSSRTPLHVAAWFGYAQCARLLLRFGADPNARNQVSQSPLMRTDSPDVAWALIEAGADVDAQVDVDAASVVQSAVRNARTRLLRVLLACCAQVNVVNSRGKSPLEYADPANTELIALLYAAGAEQRSAPVDPASIALQIAEAKRSIARMQLDQIRARALEVCIGMQPLALPALLSVLIIDAACSPFARCVRLSAKWDIAVAVKHFGDKKKKTVFAMPHKDDDTSVVKLHSKGIT